jgi:NAD+ kinase
MLHGQIVRDGQPYREFEALNDVVVAKGAIARMGDFKVYLNDQVAAAFRADGVIVATPTGSTAYNLAANGPILSPDVEAMVIAPICPHLLTLRPLVVRADAHIRVGIEGIPDQTFLTVDGQEAVQVRVGDVIHCRKSVHQLKLVRMGEIGFFNVLRQKLKWGER